VSPGALPMARQGTAAGAEEKGGDVTHVTSSL
jgi:hypothetical protein